MRCRFSLDGSSPPTLAANSWPRARRRPLSADGQCAPLYLSMPTTRVASTVGASEQIRKPPAARHLRTASSHNAAATQPAARGPAVQPPHPCYSACISPAPHSPAAHCMHHQVRALRERSPRHPLRMFAQEHAAHRLDAVPCHRTRAHGAATPRAPQTLACAVLRNTRHFPPSALVEALELRRTTPPLDMRALFSQAVKTCHDFTAIRAAMISSHSSNAVYASRTVPSFTHA